MMLENIREAFINNIVLIKLVILIIRVSFLLIYLFIYFLSPWIDLGTL